MTGVIMIAAMLSAGGFPSPQSRADYRIAVTLNPDSCTLTGTVEIDFTNGTSFPVDTLWLHLYPNAYRDHTTPFGQDLEAVGRYGFRAAPQSDRGWVDLAGWTAGGDSVTPVGRQ